MNDKRRDEIILSPEQIAEIERRLREDDCASEEEVRQVFKRLTKAPRASKPAQRQRT